MNNKEILAGDTVVQDFVQMWKKYGNRQKIEQFAGGGGGRGKHPIILLRSSAVLEFTIQTKTRKLRAWQTPFVSLSLFLFSFRLLSFYAYLFNSFFISVLYFSLPFRL